MVAIGLGALEALATSAANLSLATPKLIPKLQQDYIQKITPDWVTSVLSIGASSTWKWRAGTIEPSWASNAIQRKRTIQASLAAPCPSSAEIGGEKKERTDSNTSEPTGSAALEPESARLIRGESASGTGCSCARHEEPSRPVRGQAAVPGCGADGELARAGS